MIPSWSEEAVLILSFPAGGRTIVTEGRLDAVTKALAARRPRWSGLSISLPDRHVAPFAYGPNALANLVRAWTLNRDAPRLARLGPRAR